MMKKILFSLFAVLCVSVALAQEYTFDGESLGVYNSTCQQIIANVPAGTTMEITNDRDNGWVQVRTSTDPAIVGWVQKADIHKIEEDVVAATAENEETEKIFAALNEISGTPLGVVLAMLLLGVAVSLYALVIYIIVFLVRFIFKFDKLTRKFNRKAGMNVMPTKRLDKSLWAGLPFFVLFTISLAIFSEMKNVVLSLVVLALAIVYLFILVNRNTKIFGSRRAARWYVFFIIMAGYSVYFAGVLLWWALLLYLGFKLVYTFVTAPSNVAKCEDCGYCDRYIDGSYYCECYRGKLVEVHPKNEACKHFYRK